jgi:hypothetical protein
VPTQNGSGIESEVLKMAGKTNQERQKEYRERRAETHKRVSDIWISKDADGAWSRLAKHHGMTRLAYLEKVLVETDQALTEGMDDEAFAEYMLAVVE